MDEKFLSEFEELKNENDKLRQRLSEYETEMVPDQKESQTNTDDWDSGVNLVDSDRYNDIVFPDDFGILVMCMVDHNLNLRTEKRGGKIYTFKAGNFGAKKHIPYSDMKKIIDNQKSFFDKGLFAILNQDFLLKFGLKNAALPLGTMKRMVGGQVPAEEFVDLFKAMPEYQRNELLGQMVRAYRDNPDAYSGYFLSRIQADINLDIASRADSQKQMLKAYKNSSLLKGVDDDEKNE